MHSVVNLNASYTACVSYYCYNNCRYLGQERYEELLKMLYDGSLLLFKYQQHSSGADLAKLYVEVLKKSKTSVLEDVVSHLGELMSMIPSVAPERQVFVMTALGWSQADNPESKKFEGHPQLHKVVANVYWRGQCLGVCASSSG